MAEPKHADGHLESLLSRAGSSNSVHLTIPETEGLKALVPGIRDKLATIERRMEMLSSERDAQIAELQRIQIATASHKKLPIEILSRIFALCGPTTRVLPGDLLPISAPWTLRQVCSTWRQLALSQNSLWNNVYIPAHPGPDDEDDEDYEYKSWGSRLRMARELLPRTGLVSISLVSEYRKKDHALEDIEVALDGFVALYADRLQELQIMCPFYGYVAILETDPCLFQRVESLSLLVGGYHKYDPQYAANQSPHIDSRSFRDATRLRKFSACGESDFLDSILRQNVPWTQLTDLTFEFEEDTEASPPHSDSAGPTWGGFLPVLLQCHNLTSCNLRLLPFGGSSTIHVTLPYLRSLTLNLPVYIRSANLNFGEINPLASLTLPSLESLYLMQKHLSPLDIASLIERSGCKLRVLTDKQAHNDIEMVEISAASYDYLLQSLDHLQELYTITVFDSSDIIQIARGTRLPQLESLQFASYHPQIDVLDAFEQGFNLVPQVVGSTRKLRNVICEVGAPRNVISSDESRHYGPQYTEHTVPIDESDIEKKLCTLLYKYGVSLQFSHDTRFPARIKT